MASAGAEQRKVIIRTAIILGAITAFEFVVAFTWRGVTESVGLQIETGRAMKDALFIILTLFKASYIVGVFMHLKDEVRRLMWTILVPFIFIVWLIIALIWEGGNWGKQTPKSTSIEHIEHLPAQQMPINVHRYGA
ncbi:MAG: hypothetical protein D6730_00470 [Bacteroidetes bacterium]|nr:MAG: hypothetical protein D6730_00470 [Bacteroidota bacterium]